MRRIERCIALAFGILSIAVAVWPTILIVWRALSGARRASGDVSCAVFGAIIFGGLATLLLRMAFGDDAKDLSSPYGGADYVRAGRCPECGEQDLVRGTADVHVGGASNTTARRLTCGWRMPISADIWRALPEADTGDPYETIWDRISRARRARLTPVAVAGFLVALVGTLVLAWMLDSMVGRYVPGTSTLGLIWIGLFWLAMVGWSLLVTRGKRRPGRRCVSCGYDLSRCVGDVCPECGTSFEDQADAGVTK